MSLGKLAIMRSRYAKDVEKLEQDRGPLRLDELFTLLKDSPVEYALFSLSDINFEGNSLEPVFELERRYAQVLPDLCGDSSPPTDIGFLLELYDRLINLYPAVVNDAKSFFDFEVSNAPYKTFELFLNRVVSELKKSSRKSLKRKSESNLENNRNVDKSFLDVSTDDKLENAVSPRQEPKTPPRKSVLCFNKPRCYNFAAGRCKFYHPDMCVHSFPIKECEICNSSVNGGQLKSVADLEAKPLLKLPLSLDEITVMSNLGSTKGALEAFKACKFGRDCANFSKGKCIYFHKGACSHGFPSITCNTCRNQKIYDVLRDGVDKTKRIRTISAGSSTSGGRELLDHIVKCKNGNHCDAFRVGKCKFYHDGESQAIAVYAVETIGTVALLALLVLDL